MKKSRTLTLEQVYDLFGLKESEHSLDLERIFNVLLCSIVEINYVDADMISSTTDDAIYQKALYFYPAMREAEKRLPNYLDVKLSMAEVRKLDDWMFRMHSEIEKYNAVPWYKFIAKVKALKKYRKVAMKSVKIEKVFRFLEYRAMVRLNMSVADLRIKFRSYAKEFVEKL